MIEPKVQSLGFGLLDIEYLTGGGGSGPILRVFIENLDGRPITFEDCASVDHGLDALFETPEFTEVLSSGFNLEVSSPGIDRPLKKPVDFERFSGKRVRINTYRPLTEEEMGNSKYFQHHQKQKNFFGTLLGYSGDSVEIEADKERVKVPFSLIAKANLDIAQYLSVEELKQQLATEG